MVDVVFGQKYWKTCSRCGVAEKVSRDKKRGEEEQIFNFLT